VLADPAPIADAMVCALGTLTSSVSPVVLPVPCSMTKLLTVASLTPDAPAGHAKCFMRAHVRRKLHLCTAGHQVSDGQHHPECKLCCFPASCAALSECASARLVIDFGQRSMLRKRPNLIMLRCLISRHSTAHPCRQGCPGHPLQTAQSQCRGRCRRWCPRSGRGTLTHSLRTQPARSFFAQAGSQSMLRSMHKQTKTRSRQAMPNRVSARNLMSKRVLLLMQEM